VRKHLLKTYLFSLLLVGLAASSYAQTVYDWSGKTSTSWTNPANWRVSGVIPADYPGHVGNTDVIQFGVNRFYQFGNIAAGDTTSRPILPLGLTVNVASVKIGDNSNAELKQIDIYIDIEGTLNVTGTILQMHSNNQGIAGDGSIQFPLGYDYHIQTWFYGSGFVNATTIQIGDTTLPIPLRVNNITRFNFGDAANTAGKGLHTVITGDLIVSSITKNDPVTDTIISVSNANAGLNGGVLTIGGTLRLLNNNTINYTATKGTQFQPQARFSMGVFNNGYNTILNLQGASALFCTPKNPVNNQFGSNFFDFYVVDRQSLLNIIAGTPDNLGKTTVNYTGNVDQVVYTSSSFLASNTIFDNNGGNYNNLGFSGSGRKIIDPTSNASFPLIVSGDIALAAGTEIVDLSVNNPTSKLNTGSNIVFQSNGSSGTKTYTIAHLTEFNSATGSTFQNGSVALTLPDSTNNGGTFNTSAGALTLAGVFRNSGSFNQTGAGTVTASTTTSNTGTYNQNGTGALTFTGAVDNAGTINDANTGAININNTFTNSSTAAAFNQSAGTININNSYTNNGTFKATAGLVNINQTGAQSLVDNSTVDKGTTFFNVHVQNGGTKTLSGSGAGQFHVGSNGVMTMVSTTDLASNGFLTINSDVTGSGTVTVVPGDCHITGNVTVQRYVTANRAYRLVSSPVFTGGDGTGNIYSINYLLTNAYLVGSGGGFDKTGNPTLFLFRENLTPQITTFLNSNYRGIADISGTPYGMNDTDYPTANIPVGDGYLFYFRGSRKQASLATLTTAGAAATTDTLNAVGTLNVGNITVRNWYTPLLSTLGYTNVSTDNTVWGMNLVGNPYASSIDWDKYSTSAIPVTQLSPFTYKLIPTGAQGAGNYDVYQAGAPGQTGSQGTPNANIIASGEGFFVRAYDATAKLTFTEAAKSNFVPTGFSLYMGKPAVAAVPQFFRLQLAMDTINTDGIIVNFVDGAKTAFDLKEDAAYKVGTGKVSLSSLSSDKVSLAINALPLAGQGQVIPLKVSATADGAYSLNMKQISGIPQIYDVWLKDAFTKDSVNMRITKTKSFNIALADSNTYKNRFSIVLSQDPALAYKLLSFNADKANNKQVQLVWNTANEQNYTHFTVERSTDGGTTFDVIGSLTSSDQSTYSLLDKSPLNGTNLYRLKQVDFNNTISYSNIIPIEFANKANNLTAGHLDIFPNPVVNNITLTINPKTQEATTYHIRITNSTGMVVKQITTTQTSWQENIGNLFTGTYLVRVVNNKDNSLVGQTKFVKL